MIDDAGPEPFLQWTVSAGSNKTLPTKLAFEFDPERWLGVARVGSWWPASMNWLTACPGNSPRLRPRGGSPPHLNGVSSGPHDRYPVLPRLADHVGPDPLRGGGHPARHADVSRPFRAPSLYPETSIWRSRDHGRARDRADRGCGSKRDGRRVSIRHGGHHPGRDDHLLVLRSRLAGILLPIIP